MLVPGIRSACNRCPHCGGDQVGRHGYFPLQNGDRQQRYRCCTCRRSFSGRTGTPLAYSKKPHLWRAMAACLVRGLSVRRTAATVGVSLGTAFRWRHTLLAALNNGPQPSLSGTVAAATFCIAYSEKGSRRPSADGAPGARRREGRRRFRRFIDGKPSFVLLVRDDQQRMGVAAVSQGRPEPEDLQRTLAPLLAASADLCTRCTLVPWGEACQLMGIPHRTPTARESGDGGSRRLVSHLLDVTRSGHDLQGWIAQFRGVATRYLGHYLAWFRFKEQVCPMQLPAASRLLLLAASGECRHGIVKAAVCAASR